MHRLHLEKDLMLGAVHRHAPILSVASFRAWLTSRPDEEHWELIEGVPMMMTPPSTNREQSRIAAQCRAQGPRPGVRLS
jgi:hypothetical protein